MLKLTTVFFLFALSLLAVVHWFSIKFFLYWNMPWIDMPVHFFGGAVVALGVFTLGDFIREFPIRFLYVVPVLSIVIIVALSWELFEIVIGVPTTEPGFMVDSIIDIILGIVGGFAGFLVGHSIRKL